MAKQAKAGDDLAASGNRAELIRQFVDELRPLETEREEIAAKIREKRQEFKTATGIPLADLDAARRYADMEDEDARDQKMQNLRDCFNALSSGGQLDWVASIG